VCAAARETLKILSEEQLIQNAELMGSYFMEELRKIKSPLIRELRGMGLMIGIELKQKVAPTIRKLADHGVLVLPAGLTVLRFLPPLVINKEQIQLVIAALEEVLVEE